MGPLAAVAELERSVAVVGLKGAMIGDHGNGATYDDPSFRTLWRAAETLGAALFGHYAGNGDTIVSPRYRRYRLPILSVSRPTVRSALPFSYSAA